MSETSKTTSDQDEAFRTRPLDAGPYTFVWADELSVKVREAGRVVGVHALLAAAAVLAALGFTACRIGWPGWLPAHIVAMAGSYIAMLTAFYVDNGPRLPLWNLLPPITFWFLPAAVGLPILGYALRRHLSHQRQTHRETRVMSGSGPM